MRSEPPEAAGSAGARHRDDPTPLGGRRGSHPSLKPGSITKSPCLLPQPSERVTSLASGKRPGRSAAAGVVDTLALPTNAAVSPRAGTRLFATHLAKSGIELSASATALGGGVWGA